MKTTILAFARVVFGKVITLKTKIVFLSSSCTEVKYLDKPFSKNIISLDKYFYKSNKRELTIRFAFADKINTVFVKRSEAIS